MKFRQGNVQGKKLTPSKVYEMRQRFFEQGWTQGALAREYGVSVGQVGRITRGESWQQYQMPEDPSVEMHEQALAARSEDIHQIPLSAERERSIEESQRRLDELLAKAKPREMPLTAEARERARAYGGRVDDEPTGAGLAKLSETLLGFSDEERVSAESELERFLNEGDSK